MKLSERVCCSQTNNLLLPIIYLSVIAVKCPIPTTAPNMTNTGDLREFIFGESITYTCIRGHRFPKAEFGANVSAVNVTCTVSNHSETTGNWSHFLPSCESKSQYSLSSRRVICTHYSDALGTFYVASNTVPVPVFCQ